MARSAAGDRFAEWSASPARAVLALVAAVLIACALTPLTHTHGEPKTPSLVPSAGAVERPRDDDLGLYDAITARLARGENYYIVAVNEHRRVGFPLQPGVAVRLPTLAYANALLGDRGMIAAAIALILATLAAWWRRMGDEPGGADRRLVAMALLLVGVSTGLNRYFFQLHELWSGILLALAFAVYRPGQWRAALAVAALALAIREHALPFVLLMGAMAARRRDWKETAAWGALAAIFLAALGVHVQLIAAQVVPSDGHSASWLALRGLAGWLSDIVLSSNLRFLPHWLAGPLVALMLLGWAGWRSAAGVFGTLLYAGYAALFMIAGRVDNYYWGAMVAPAMFIGLAFAPRALKSLWDASFARR